MYDLIIKNVRIIDGTGAPWYRGSVAVKDGKIAAVGSAAGFGEREEACAEVIDGQDKYLSPGFIDMHCHSDSALPLYPMSESRILQGVTTEIGGACGISVAPVSEEPEKKKMLRDYVRDMDFNWNTVGEYLDTIEKMGISTNFGTAVGHGTIRLKAMGFDDRKPTDAEMEDMKKSLRQAMDDGAFCFSSGLIYPPGCYADAEELTELCKELVPYGAYYETHMRNEGEGVVEAVKEAIAVAEGAGVPLQISHHKVIRKSVWQVHSRTTIALIDQARRRGLDVKADQYPYTASATSLDSNLPNWTYEGGVEKMLGRLKDPETRAQIKEEVNASHIGRWGDIYVAYVATDKNQWTAGKSLEEIGNIRGVDPADACFDLLIEENNRVGEVNFGMCEDDIEYIMKQPYVMIISDGEAASLEHSGQPHPRWYGTFPRVLAKYARERKLISLETAVFKMTGLPASRAGLQNRGLIRGGMCADLVLFDFDTINDTPSYDNPKQACEGILKVYVNGVLTAENGRHTGARAGKVLRRGVNC